MRKPRPKVDPAKKAIFKVNFKRLVAASGMGHAQIARECGCSMGAMAKWSRGASLPSAERLNRLAEVLRVREAEFFAPIPTDSPALRPRH